MVHVRVPAVYVIRWAPALFSHPIATCLWTAELPRRLDVFNVVRSCRPSVHAVTTRQALLMQDVSILSRHLFPTGFEFAKRALDEHAEHLDDYDYVLPHLSSFFFRRKVERILNELSTKAEQSVPYWTNLATAGNTGSAIIYILLDQFLREHELRDGQRIAPIHPRVGTVQLRDDQFDRGGCVMHANSFAPRKRLAIIGGGSSGLVSLKYALDALPDWEVVCFEKSNSNVGCWGQPYPGFISTSTKYTTQFACFPVTDAVVNSTGQRTFEEFFREDEYGRYLTDFVQRFQLQPHIRLNTQVSQLQRTEAGQWRLTLRTTGSTASGPTRSTSEELFDATIICTAWLLNPSR